MSPSKQNYRASIPWSIAVMLAAADPSAASLAVEQPFRLGTYYEQNGFNNCNNSNFCDIVFAAVPAGKVLTAQQIACSVRSQNILLQSLTLFVSTSSESFQRSHPLDAAPLSTTGTTTHYVARNDTEYPIRSGGAPRIRALTAVPAGASEIVVSCQISGRLTAVN